MPKLARGKAKHRSEDRILDDATVRLLRAVKEKAEKNRAPLKREQLREEGYSERFIDKVERA